MKHIYRLVTSYEAHNYITTSILIRYLPFVKHTHLGILIGHKTGGIYSPFHRTIKDRGSQTHFFATIRATKPLKS